MSNQLQPGRVEVRDVWTWVVQATALCRRRPLLFTVLSVGFFYVCHLLVMSSYLTLFIGLVLCQVVLSIVIEIARTVDESKPISLNRCYAALQNTVVSVLLLSLFYVLMWVIAEKVATMFMVESIVGDSLDVAPISFLQWLYPGTAGLFIVYLGTMVTTMWFLLPISVFHKLPFIETLQLAKQGERINGLVIIVASYAPFFIYFVLFTFSELSLLVAIAGIPWFGSYLYVSYRHVYLQRKENAPEVVKSLAAETQTT